MEGMIQALSDRETALIRLIEDKVCGGPSSTSGVDLVWFQPVILPVATGGTETPTTITMPRAFVVAHVFAYCAEGLSAVRFGYYPDSDQSEARSVCPSLETQGSAVVFPRAAHQMVADVASIRPGQPRLWEGRAFERGEKMTLVTVDASSADEAYTLELTIVGRVARCR